jgi:orotidine-5'-phosphate decarboxylase
MKKKIFIAFDTNEIKNAKRIISETNKSRLNLGYKFGLEFFNSKNGRAFISKIKNKDIWLDLKLYDIPNTVASAIYSLKDLKNIKYLTVHISGGIEMIKKAKKLAARTNKNLKILGVTILTSFNEKDIKKTGHTKNIKELVLQQVKLARLANLDGIVCSGYEVLSIKRIFKKEIITPGIRLPGDSKQDQRRVMTPKSAFKNGATGIVIGRSITRGNIKYNIQKLINSLK